MEKNKYKVDGIDCQLKELTLDEVDEVNEFWKNLQVEANTLTLKTTNDSVEKLFSMILEPCNPIDSNKNINYRKVTETTSMSILKDFFLSRVAIGRTLQSFYPNSIKQQKML